MTNKRGLSPINILPGTGEIVNFEYDPFGRRIYKSSSLGTTIFIYDGATLIEEVDDTGLVKALYTHGLGIDEPLSMQRGGTMSYYHADGLGSITSLTNFGADVVSSYQYDSFGNLTNSTGSISNPFLYTGRELDIETGLYFYRARYYDPSIGRFISEDPIQFKGGNNFYGYVNNDPVNAVDPWGLKECIELCWLSEPSSRNIGLKTSWDHKTSGGPPNTIGFEGCNCPDEYPILEDTWLANEGKTPRSPGDHKFPDWKNYPYGKENSKTFAVPTSTVTYFFDESSLSRVRMCGKCCKECEE